MSKAPTKPTRAARPAPQEAVKVAVPAHDHSHDGHETDHLHRETTSHGSMKGYLIGFGLSVVLTAIPFWLVMSGAFAPQTTGGIIMAFAVAQIVVHMIFFLHMNSKSEGGWTILALIFTLIIVVIALTGSLWVMYHLNTNMMPEHGMNMNPAP
jgi:cytochrome o ubiquinol oxidase operon protein cyoD